MESHLVQGCDHVLQFYTHQARNSAGQRAVYNRHGLGPQPVPQSNGCGVDRGNAKRCKLLLAGKCFRFLATVDNDKSTGLEAGGNSGRDKGGIQYYDVIRFIDLVRIADRFFVVAKKCLQRSTGTLSRVDAKGLHGMTFQMLCRGKDLGERYATLSASPMNPVRQKKLS